MAAKLDISQYGNQKGVSVQHCLIRIIHRILTALDHNTRRETCAVIATMINWSSAFIRQCHKIDIESFIQNGVRSSLIPVLNNYFQDRKMIVKHHGCTSVPRKLNGGGPMGATFGLLEHLSHSNHSVNCVDPNDRFKFVDDLSVLEIINAAAKN